MVGEKQPKNAIEKRIDRLAEIWNEFAENADARLLRWVADSDTAKMLDLFLALQNEDASDIPDLFVRFHEPFEDAAEYGFTLRESLIAKYDEIRAGIAAEGIPAEWDCPAIDASDTGSSAFVRACASLRKYYDGMLVHVVAVLTPHEIADPGGWQTWLDALVQMSVAPNLRFMVIEAETPRLLDDLCAAHPQRVVSVEPDLDMLGAYSELVRAIPGSGPGFTFRRLFIALTGAAAVGNLDAAKQAADRALKIAVEQNWPQMQTVVHMALGAAHFSAGDSAATLACYRNANQAIAGKDDPAAPKLDIQTRFAEAGVLVGEQKYEQAAGIYEQIAPLAQQHEELFALLESRRMAAYCRQCAGQYEAAWTEGHKALEVAELLDDETRVNSTLPYVGQGLLQLVEDGHVDGRAEEIRQRMTQLVGEDWEDKLATGAAVS